MNTHIQRSFIIGEEWIYYKIYLGVKTADLILINNLKSVLEKLVASYNVDQWFFIRYSDPDFHLRLRIHMSNPDQLIHILNLVNKELKELKEKGLIWKVQMDTYDRELERYGAPIMEQSERLFYYDSLLIINALDVLEEDENSNLKWLWGLKIVDKFMDDFGLSIQEKKNLMEDLTASFGQEFGVGNTAKKQINPKYIQFKKEIDSVINSAANDYLFLLLENKSSSIKGIAKVITQKSHDSAYNINYIISSHIHMTMNRLFRTKNRKNEFVSYTMLLLYYESKIARIKYDKNTI